MALCHATLRHHRDRQRQRVLKELQTKSNSPVKIELFLKPLLAVYQGDAVRLYQGFLHADGLKIVDSTTGLKLSLLF
ncbi:MAG: hypothetical protein ACRCWF_05825 [Beijerinckiaceae bacterium]